MAIEETIEVSVAGIGQVDALAAALDKAAESAARLNGMVAKGGAGAGGAGGAGAAEKQAAAMDAAAARTEKAAKRMSAAIESMSGIGDAAAAGLAPAADAIDAVAAANGRLAESGKLAANAQRAVARATAAAGKAMDKTAEGTDAAAAANSRVAKTSGESAAALDAQAGAATRAGKSHATAAESSTKFWKGVKVAAIGGAVGIAYGLDQAMKLQTQVTRLYTAAGLTGVKPGTVDKDVLGIGSKTGFSGTAIAEAMYHPVSAGLDYKTSKGLTEQAANLANVHGANIDDTTYAMSSIMKAYNEGANKVIPTAALLNSIVGKGDMKFQDLNEAVKNFAPTGASMGISLQSMGAGLAYLTDRGNTAEVASTRLTMGLSMATAGSKAANTYLRDLGLTTGSLDLKNKSLQKTMKAGGLTTNKFAADLKKPDGLYVALNDMQGAFTKAGLSKGQADQVMSKIFGGGRSDKAIVSLMQNLDGLRQKYNDIGKDATPAKYMASVAKEQATAQQKWKDFLASGQNLAAGFGNAMLPTFTKIAGAGASLLQGKGGGIAGGILGGALALFAGNKLFHGAESAVGTVGKVGKFLDIPGLNKLGNIGKVAGSGAAASGLDAVAGAADGAAAALSRVSEVGAVPGGVPGKAGGGAAAGEGAAAGAAGAAGAGEAAVGAEAVAGAGILAGIKTIGLKGLIRGGIGFAVADIAERLVAGNLPKPTKAQSAALKPDERGLGWWVDTHMLGKQGAENAGNLIDRLQKNVPIRHSIASTFVATRHGVSSLFSSTGTAGPQTPQENIRFGAGIVGATRPPPPPPPPRVPFYGEANQPGGAASQRIPQLSLGGRPAAATAQQLSIKPIKIPPPDMSAIAGAMAKIKALTSQQANVKPIKIPAPDTSAIAGVKAKITGMMAGISIKPPKIPAPDMGALDSAKGKAASAGSGITSAIQGAMKPAKMPPPDLSAAQGAAGQAEGIGANISGGLAAGIRSGIGAIQAAAAAAAAAASVAMAAEAIVKSPSEKTKRIGKEMAAGLVVGLEGGTDAVSAAGKALSQAATKPADIASIDSTIAKLKKQVSGKPAMVMWLEGEQSDLEKLAAKRSRLETEITNSTQAAQSVISGASIMNSLNATVPGSADPIASSAIVQGQGYQATNLAAFAKQLTSLQKAGLNATSLSQIAQSGPDQGLGIAQGINSGGKQAITQLNAIQKKIHTSAIQIGDVTGTAMYQSGQDIGKGLAQGLKDALKVTEKDIEKEAKRVASVIDKVSGPAKAKAKAASKAAGSSSSSSGSGSASAAGGVKGWDGAASKLTSAGGALTAAASALTSAAGSLKAAVATSASAAKSAHHPLSPGGGVMHYPVSSGGGGGGSGGGGDVHVHLHVAGNARVDKDWAKSMQTIFLNQADRNLRTGLKLKDRGA